MWRSVIVCQVLLLSVGTSKEAVIPHYNLNVSHVQNRPDSWFVEIRLEHDIGHVYDMHLSNSNYATVARISHPGGNTGGSIGAPKTCPTPKALGYELVPGLGYYKLFLQNLKPWEDAKKACESEGTHLLIINSDLEALVIRTMVERNPTSRPWGHWVGFRDLNKTGDYITIFNETLESTGYTAWRSGQPTTEASHRCGYFQFIPDKNTHGIGVYLCTHANPFICEQEIDS